MDRTAPVRNATPLDALDEALAVYFGAGLGREDDEALVELLRDAVARGLDVEAAAKKARQPR